MALLVGQLERLCRAVVQTARMAHSMAHMVVPSLCCNVLHHYRILRDLQDVSVNALVCDWDQLLVSCALYKGTEPISTSNDLA